MDQRARLLDIRFELSRRGTERAHRYDANRCRGALAQIGRAIGLADSVLGKGGVDPESATNGGTNRNQSR